MSTAKSLLRQAADKLPTPNGVALAIMQLWQDEQASVNQIARIVQSDPALCGRLLRRANSASIGLHPVTSIPESIIRIGLKTVGELAIAFSLIDVNSSEDSCPSFDYLGFWSQCLLMALICRALGRLTRLASSEEVFTCALMARIGLLAFATVYPRAFSELLAAEPTDLVSAERQRFGFDHNELSAEMLASFGVPEALVGPAKFHEDPHHAGFAEDSPEAKLATLFHLGYQLSQACLQVGISAAGDTNQAKALAGQLGLPAEQLATLLSETVQEWREWLEFLELPEASLPSEHDPDQERAGESPATGATSTLRALLVQSEGAAPALLRQLEANGLQVHVCHEEQDVLRVALELQPQLIMIAEDAGIEKERLCRPIRSTEWGKTVYIIVLLNDYENEQVALALTAGADTCVPKAFDARALDAHLQVVQRFVDLQAKWASDRAELHRIARELALSHRRLEVLSLTDQLTGLGNRRSAIDALDRAWRQSERAGMPMSVIMLDIDHFKRVNDQFGHAAGDQVLADVAGALQKATRQGEGTYRMGGEEFLLLSTAPEIKQLVVIAERLRRRIAGLHIAYGEHVIQVTTSLGLAVREPEHEHVDALLSAADQALYAAKAGGRNCFYFNHNNRIRTIKATATG